MFSKDVAPSLAAFVHRASIPTISGVSSAGKTTFDVIGAAPSNLIFLSHVPQRPDHIVKGLLNIDTVLRRCFNKLASHVFRQSTTLLYRHFPVSHSITLVPHKHHWGRLPGHMHCGRGRRCKIRASCWGPGAGRLFDALYLAVELAYACKRRSRGDTVDKDEPLTVAYPLVSEGCIFFLPSCVQNFQHA